ncbi:MAG: nucleoside monophosphate kinase, partial [Desulfurococcaceae archaeon]
MVKIVISGPPGSGKTTQALLIAKHYNLKYFSAGRIFREIATSRGLTLEELSKQALTDPSIDIEVDMKTIEAAKEDNIVIDGHVAAWI